MTAVDASSANASSCVAAAAASAVFSCVLRGRDGDENEDDHVVDRRKKFSCNLARFRGDTESSSSGEDAEVYRRPPPVSSRAPTTQPSALVTRDRSNHFQRLRSMRQQRSLRKLSTEQRMSAVDRAAASLSRSYHAAVQTHASLGTKLAQHNGLRQFGVEFKGRAPPLELRMLLPDLENSIHDQLEELEEFATRLDGLTFSDELGHARPETAKLCKVRDEALANLRRITEEVKATFEEQRCHLQELAAASPLLSTRFSAELGPPAAGSPKQSCARWPHWSALSDDCIAIMLQELLAQLFSMAIAEAAPEGPGFPWRVRHCIALARGQLALEQHIVFACEAWKTRWQRLLRRFCIGFLLHG
eukprot:TRINITY_DN8187_c0_g1_i6.p1 TRINITY_DN8187_c0_g1~~TRINITY_DN8187_c0_g1_i6.p1  ORF type:complete len:360 (+),score=77.13 TRINITY_DN8187_c0_g1_i6:81-1160(+)